MNKIRFLRIKNSLKQEDLAKTLQISQSSLSGYENGRYEPDSKMLLKIAGYFGVSVDYLLGRNVPGKQENEPLKQIPVYRKIGCGLQKKESNAIYYEVINRANLPEGEYFGLIVNDNRMEPRIRPGDLVIAHRQDTAPNSSIAIVQIGSYNATLFKVVKPKCGGIVLVSFILNYDPVFYTEEQIASLPIRILGVMEEFRGKC